MYGLEKVADLCEDSLFCKGFLPKPAGYFSERRSFREGRRFCFWRVGVRHHIGVSPRANAPTSLIAFSRMGVESATRIICSVPYPSCDIRGHDTKPEGLV
jgi:hypothetical protein